jgi:hypothetical protein
MCAVSRICSWFAATLLLAAAVPAAGGTHLILSESTADAFQLEPLQTLPDFTTISPGSIYGLAASQLAISSDVYVYQPNTQTLINLSDLPPDERADYVCTPKPVEQYGSGISYGFEPATAQSNTEYVQGAARLRWIDRDPDPVRCSGLSEMVISRGAVDFGIVAVGGTANVAVEIGNAGTAALLIGTLALPSGPFAITSDGCSGATLGAGSQCTFTVQFSPSSTAAVTRGLAVRSNDPLRLTRTLLLAGGYFNDLIFADSFDGVF